MVFERTLWKCVLAMVSASLLTLPLPVFAASHREAPITALDQKVDITDWYAFVSPENSEKVVMILNVDPFLEPSNGPNYFPFDPGIRYEMKVDNDRNGLEDVTFQFRFHTEVRAPGVFTGYVGNLAGIPPITALDGPGSEGLNFRQSYTVTMVTRNGARSSPPAELYLRFRPTWARARCPLTNSSGSRESTSFRTRFRCSPALSPTRSSSIWELRLIP